MGKAPVVLADADGFADGIDLIGQFVSGNTHLQAQAAKVGRGFPQWIWLEIYTMIFVQLWIVGGQKSP